MKSIGRLSLMLMLGLFYSVVAQADDKTQAAKPGMDPVKMEKMKAAMTPGAAHKALEPLAGKWNYTAKFWMAPDQPAEQSTGTSESTIIYGGRFIKDIVKGTWMGEPFEGTGYTGYDNMKGEYQGVWIDSSMTGLMTSTGQYDAATKTFKMSGVGSCPLTGEKNHAYRSETTIQDSNHYTMSSYSTGPDGKEFKGMELSFTRVS